VQLLTLTPQLYTVATTNWLPEGLHYLLPPQVQPNMKKLGLAGHSRGGKAAFALVLEKAATSLKFSALIGIDPVDGLGKGLQTPPPVLTYVPHSFDLYMPPINGHWYRIG
jgi:chlorophyllase